MDNHPQKCHFIQTKPFAPPPSCLLLVRETLIVEPLADYMLLCPRHRVHFREPSFLELLHFTYDDFGESSVIPPVALYLFDGVEVEAAQAVPEAAAL